MPYRGGAMVSFPVHKINPVTGKLIVGEGLKLVIPAEGEISLGGVEPIVSSPIGRRGQFYFEDLAPGHYKALIDFADGSCKFPMTVPEPPRTVARLGTLTCVMKGGRP